ncbi:MAG: hypothetical protein JWP10_1798, partial [Nocardioidaceae bacterium]|nr:hypothetical protein [Nocardioidaceae bacterium]
VRQIDGDALRDVVADLVRFARSSEVEDLVGEFDDARIWIVHGMNLPAQPHTVECMLIAEDLLRLLTDPVTGKRRVDAMHLDTALGGAVLLDLLLANKVALEGEGRKARVVTIDPTATGDHTLDGALEMLAQRGRIKPKDAVVRIAKKLRPQLYASLAAQGVVSREDRKVWVAFTQTTWPATDPSWHQGIDQTLREVLLHDQDPDQRTGALVALASSAGAIKKLVDKPDRKRAQRRAERISEGNWASEAVREAIRAAQVAASAAAVAAAAAAGASGS